MTVIDVPQLATFTIAMVVLFIGSRLSSRIYFIQKYNLPEPVVGGLMFSIVSGLLFFLFDLSLNFDSTIMHTMMLAFFTTVGLNAKATLIKQGGKKVFLFLLVTTVFLIVQDTVGVSLATLLGLNPKIGLLAGSITLSGGHGTGAIYASKFHDVKDAMEIAMACATFGLILGGIIGGPVAEKIITKYKLAPDTKIKDPFIDIKDHGMNEPESVTATSMFKILLINSVCIMLSQYMQEYLSAKGVLVPGFIIALFLGIIIGNSFDYSKKHSLPQQTIDVISIVSLYTFLTIALMNLKIWELLDLAGPLFIIVFIQTITLIAFAFFVTFRVMGKNYEAAVMASGHMGFGLGATPTAVANMEKIILRYGPAPQALLTVPIVGAFFIDIVNTSVIQMFLYFF